MITRGIIPVRVMRQEGRVLPVYQDKYLAYEWADARNTYDSVRTMKIPFLCGSTVPLTWQRPASHFPRGVRAAELLATSYSDIEEHAYHGIEMLQSMAERRAGGEMGVARVRWVAGAELWKQADQSEWSRDLLEAAMAKRVNRVPDSLSDEPQAFLIRCRDGLRAAVLHLNSQTRVTCSPPAWNSAGWFRIETSRRRMGRYTGACNFLLAAASFAPILAAEFRVLDVQRVPLTGNPAQAVIRVTVPDNVPGIACDVLVAGAGMGGVGASLAIAGRSHSVCLTKETDWVGGQATSGGVSALDENRYIELSGATRSYRQFRDGTRDWYRTNTKLTVQAASRQNLNPGSCYVSALCFEPKVGVAVLDRMLQKPGINLHRRTAIFAIERHGARIESALAWQFEQRKVIRFRVRFMLDATEMGDLLPLAKVPYVSGAEPKSETGEPDTPEKGDASCVQSFTYPFAVEHARKAGALTGKLPEYEHILQRQGFSLQVIYPAEFGWKGKFQYHMFGNEAPVPNNMSPGAFFPWRRLIYSRNFESGVPRDIALMNWPRQDYAAESPLNREPDELAAIFQRCRMLARGSVREQDIVDDMQTGARARKFADSVGTGFYMVDIHPCGANEHGRMRMPKPFQIPMSALLPREPLNFLPAGKNLGVTHLTNGAFRLHPIEWNVGEAAGTIASLELETGVEPPVAIVQRELAHQGIPFYWTDLREDRLPMAMAPLQATQTGPVKRWEFAMRMAAQ